MSGLTVTFAHVAHLCRHLADIGARSYTCAADGHHDVAMPFPAPDRTISLRDLYERDTKGRRPMDPAFEADLRNNGFEAFSSFGAGESTWVYAGHHAEGHDYAVRMSFKKRERRNVTPLVVQPYSEHEQRGLLGDVTPIIQILSIAESSVPIAQDVQELRFTSIVDGDDPNAGAEVAELVLENVLRQAMLAAYCLSTQPSPYKDIGILPDGTPIQPDPGQIEYWPELDHRSALAAFRREPLRADLPQLNWFAPDGTFKQDAFFRNPFKRTPYYRGFNPA